MKKFISFIDGKMCTQEQVEMVTQRSPRSIIDIIIGRRTLDALTTATVAGRVVYSDVVIDFEKEVELGVPFKEPVFVGDYKFTRLLPLRRLEGTVYVCNVAYTEQVSFVDTIRSAL